MYVNYSTRNLRDSPLYGAIKKYYIINRKEYDLLLLLDPFSHKRPRNLTSFLLFDFPWRTSLSIIDAKPVAIDRPKNFSLSLSLSLSLCFTRPFYPPINGYLPFMIHKVNVTRNESARLRLSIRARAANIAQRELRQTKSVTERSRNVVRVLSYARST